MQKTLEDILQQNMNPKHFKVNVGRFGCTSELEKAKILEEKNSKNTDKATKCGMNCLFEYIKAKNLPDLNSMADSDFPKLLEDFYMDLHTKDKQFYKTSSMKSMRSNINRWFKENKKLDIISDTCFVESNSMFKAMQVQAKKSRKGVKKSTKLITEEDLERIGTYFDHPYISNPNPALLQETVMFNIMYYFCHHGQENLHEMTKRHFKVRVNYDGTCYVCQVIDELDKNHRESMANQAKMYAEPGKLKLLPFIKLQKIKKICQ